MIVGTLSYHAHDMTTSETRQALDALAALAQETRLAVFRLLVEHSPDGLTAGALAERLDIAAPTLSFHLKELTHAGLVASRQDGRFIWYRADIAAMNTLIAYLTRNCCVSSAVCDPACAPFPAPAQTVLTKVVAASIRRAPRKIAEA
jgi:DNA-binding transcriptional ArsR family regulator